MSKKPLPEPSEEFLIAIIHSSSSVVNCEFCGRTHFGDISPGEEHEPGEFEKLLKQSKKEPDKFIYHPDTDSVRWGDLDGRQYVPGCPCNSASRYEQLFWRHRHLIRDYFSARAKKESERAQCESALAQSVSEAVENS